MPAAVSSLFRPVAGFEASGYAWRGDELVFIGRDGRQGAEHPRNLLRPWRPAPRRPAFDARRLGAGARVALAQLQDAAAASVGEGPGTAAAPGLLPWLLGRPLGFPLQAATPRLDALRDALQRDDVDAFERAAVGVLGLGPGLTPSGDDLLGGIGFALVHAPRPGWAGRWPRVRATVRAASVDATHVISATLLADLLRGIGYRALHELLDALHDGSARGIRAAVAALADIGAASGRDLLAGVLLALDTAPATRPSP